MWDGNPGWSQSHKWRLQRCLWKAQGEEIKVCFWTGIKFQLCKMNTFWRKLTVLYYTHKKFSNILELTLIVLTTILKMFSIWKWNILQNLKSMLSGEIGSSHVEVIAWTITGLIFILLSSIAEESSFSDQGRVKLEWSSLSTLSLCFSK